MVNAGFYLKMQYKMVARGLKTACVQYAPSSNIPGKPWREAASLILVSPTPLPGTENPSNKPHFLMTERSQGGGAFSRLVCFPGGNVAEADHDKGWLDKFAMATGHYIDHQLSFIKDEMKNPKIDTGAKHDIPKSISLRITAIRETFEETGILLCKGFSRQNFGKGLGKHSKVEVGSDATVVAFEDQDELAHWQEQVRRDPNQFMKLCDELTCLPDVNALVEWNSWLTPNSWQTRYDTIFYMVVVPQAYQMTICPQEMESAHWLTAEKMLQKCEERTFKMIAPQIYELTRLKSASMSRLRNLMRIRLKLGIEGWCPCYIHAQDGYLSVFPGDDLYPEDMDITKFEPIRKNNATLDELRDSTKNHHRIQYRNEFDFNIMVKNYRERMGHIYLD